MSNKVSTPKTGSSIEDFLQVATRLAEDEREPDLIILPRAIRDHKAQRNASVRKPEDTDD